MSLSKNEIEETKSWKVYISILTPPGQTLTFQLGVYFCIMIQENCKRGSIIACSSCPVNHEDRLLPDDKHHWCLSKCLEGPHGSTDFVWGSQLLWSIQMKEFLKQNDEWHQPKTPWQGRLTSILIVDVSQTATADVQSHYPCLTQCQQASV